MNIEGTRPVIILALCGLALGAAACVPFYTRRVQADLPPPPEAFGPLPTARDGDPPAQDSDATALAENRDPDSSAPAKVGAALRALVDPALAAVPKAFLDAKTGAMILSRSGRNVFEHVTETLGEVVPERSQAHLKSIDQSPPVDIKPVTYTHELPKPVTFEAGGYQVEFSPHVSLHVGEDLTEAEAGGMLRVSRSPAGGKEVDLLGVSPEADKRGAKAQRWYLFIGASGRAIDWRAIRNTGGGDRWVGSSDATTVFLQAAQAGFAWRRGALQTAIAFVMRKATSGGPFTDIYPGNEQIVALTVSLRPGTPRPATSMSATSPD